MRECDGSGYLRAGADPRGAPVHRVTGRVVCHGCPVCLRPTRLQALPTIQPLPELVAMLEEALARAKSGELRSCALMVETTGQCIATQFEIGDGDLARMVYAIETLKMKLIMVGE